jgi:hypothetical protein
MAHWPAARNGEPTLSPTTLATRQGLNLLIARLVVTAIRRRWARSRVHLQLTEGPRVRVINPEEDELRQAFRRKHADVEIILRWLSLMQEQGRVPPDVAEALDRYFSGLHDLAIAAAAEVCWQ